MIWVKPNDVEMLSINESMNSPGTSIIGSILISQAKLPTIVGPYSFVVARINFLKPVSLSGFGKIDRMPVLFRTRFFELIHAESLISNNLLE